MPWCTPSRLTRAGTRRTPSRTSSRARRWRSSQRTSARCARTALTWEARGNMLLGSMLAGMAFANAPVAAVHALAYPIGAIFHVPHGLSNALVLMGVLRFNLPEAQALYAELAPILDPQAHGLPTAERAQAFVDALAATCRDCKVPASLAEVGVSEADLPRLAEDAMKQTRLLVNNPREVTYQDAYAIYSEALDGKKRQAAQPP